MFVNARTGKPYPMPTNAARDRARAHKAMAMALAGMEEKAHGATATYVAVIRMERERQDGMVAAFHQRYGGNAGV